jgi:hypothetical protein
MDEGLMRGTYRRLLLGVFATMATPAFADSLHGNRYEMVTVPEARNIGVIFVLDGQTGDAWSWSEASAVFVYRGRIFPIGGAGTIARIINVESGNGAR